MMKDYMSMIYENDDASLVKLNGYIVTAIDGSDIVLSSTEENAEKYGVHSRDSAAGPVMAKLSLVYDCINKLVIDTCVGEYKHSERIFASLRLVDQMMDDGQKFVIRMDNRSLKRYSSQVASGADRAFRTKLRHTTYPLRLVKSHW